MSKTLLVRMAVPIPSQPIVPVPAMIFHRWLPIKDDDFLIVEKGNLRLTFWFDMPCTNWARDHFEADLSGIINVTAHRINADVLVSGISDELAKYIIMASTEPSPPESPLKAEYKALGTQVYLFVMTYFNRLVRFVRAEKGQYWLDEYAIQPGRIQSAFTQFGAKVKVHDGEWCKWRPTEVEEMTYSVPDERLCLERSDWERVKKFVPSSNSTSLVPELLARAEAYAGAWHRRPALIEAVTALEVAISRFVRQPMANEAFGPLLAQRMGVTSLPNQHENLGLRGTVRYLFAVIFTEDKMPTDLLVTCQQAIDERNNVVHNGQRDVPEARLSAFLPAIRRICDILAGYSCVEEGGPTTSEA